MDNSVFRISLDMHRQTTQAHLAVKKGDTGRRIIASLSDGGVAYRIDPGCYAVLMAQKADGNVLYNDCTIENNKIIYQFTEQTAAAAGRMVCELRLYGSDDKLITSPRIAIVVNGTIYEDPVVESSSEYTALTKMLQDVQRVVVDGELKSETVAAQHLDLRYEMGTINTSTGTEVGANNRIRSNMFPILGKTIGIVLPSTMKARFVYYQADKTFLDRSSGERFGPHATVTAPKNAVFSRVLLGYADDSEITSVEDLTDVTLVYIPLGGDDIYRGNVAELGFTSFRECELPGYYSYKTEDIATLTDAPEGLTAGGIITVQPVSSGTVFQTITTRTKQIWARSGSDPFIKIVSGLDADRQLCYWGNVMWQGTTFAACTKSGYYKFQFADIEKITDAPVGLISGGILEVRDNAANGTVFQTIHCANGEEWFRYGENDFIKICRDQSQIDNLYAALGIVNPGSLIQGAPTTTGTLNKNTKLSICAPKPMYFGAGVSYNVLVDDGWCFTVTEFDDAECSTAGATYYNKSNSTVYVPRRDYCWVRFNKLGDDGEYAEITPADFDASVVFQRSDRASGGGGGSDIRSDTPENIGVRNALLNAKQCSQIRYTPIAALPTQKYEAGFPAGQEVQGLPYSSTRLEQLYVPNNVSFHTFMSALQNPKSLLYSVKLDEDYGVDNARTYYGIVCSILAEYALGIKPGYTTAMWDKIPGMELIEDQSPYGLRLCDVLWRSGHVLLVTDIKRTGDGTIHSIEVTEATAGRDGSVDVISYGLDKFISIFVDGDTEYKFYRYRYLNQAKHTPTAIVPVGGESFADDAVYNTNLMGRLGDRFNVRSGEDVVLDVLDQGAYTGYKVTKNGADLSTAAIPGDGVITLSGLAYGKYSVCLTGSGADSRAIEFIVVDAAAPTVTATGNTNEYKLDFFSANATTPYIMWFVDNSRKAVVTQIDELTGNETSFATVLEKTSGYVRVALETEYGIILSESAVGNFTGAPVEDEYPRDVEHYYSSVSDAISDINSGIVSKAAVDGSVKVFTSDTGVLTVSLLDDAEEIASVTVEKSLNIALNGHTLRLIGADAVLQFAAGTDCTVYGGLGEIIKKSVASSDKIFLLRADGAMLSIRETEIGLNAQAGTFAMAVRAAGGLVDMEDCHIESINTADGGAWAIQASAGEIVAKRCTLQVSNVGNKTGHQFYNAIGIVSGAKVTMENSNIISASQKGYATGIKAFVGSSTDLIDTTISVVTNTDGSLSAAIGVLNHAGATLRVDGGKILADAPGDSTPEDYAIGVENGGVCHLKNANISGTHSAVSNDANGKLYVDGGLYTGYSHGGFYFAHGADGVAYVNDATLRDGHYEGVFADVFSGNTEGIGTLGGFYIGGGSGENNSNMAVYLDGCTFDVTNWAFVLRGTDGETNNTVNISNSTVLDAANHPIRIDNETLRVNIGIGGNITPDMALTHEGEDASAWAHLSNRLYRRKYDDPDYMALANAAVIAPNKAAVGQTIRVKSVDEDGKPVEWECVDATNKDEKPFASVILTGKAYQILSYVDGVVDLGVPGLHPPTQGSVALRKKDYSGYVMCRITETSTPGQYSFTNLDNGAYVPTIDNIDDYVIEIPDATSISVKGVEKFNHLKCRLTTPRWAVHGARASIKWDGYAPSGLNLGADYVNYGNSSLEYTWETKPSDFDSKVWLYSSLRTGKWNYSTINQFRLVDTPTPQNYIMAGHSNGLLTVGTKLEVWGA